MKVSDIVNYLLEKYPLNTAYDSDAGKIGLQFGSMNYDVKKVLIALDGSLAVVEEAENKNIDFLLLHHPFMYYPMLNLNYDSINGKKMLTIFKNKINVFAMHTNYDVGLCGMNDVLATKIGLKNIRMTEEEPSPKTLIRIGEVEPMLLSDFVKQVACNLEESSIRFVGDPNKVIKTVGIVGGSGASEMYTALRNQCDVFVTGEVHHHQALDAYENGLSLVEVSHSIERHFASVIKKDLEERFPDVEFIISENNINPFKSL